MKNRYPEPICDGNPTPRDRIWTAIAFGGSAVVGIAIWAAIIIGAVRVFWGL